jgi:light-regulated signal transduction histidine kinase (bacteriophytochrome)
MPSSPALTTVASQERAYASASLSCSVTAARVPERSIQAARVPASCSVEVVAACSDRDGARIEIHDHGVGIAPEDRESIFDRFHQGDQSATRRFGGFGLGLHLVRSMAEELGGRVDVDAGEDGGSVFLVTLPPPDPSLLPYAATVGAGARWA